MFLTGTLSVQRPRTVSHRMSSPPNRSVVTRHLDGRGWAAQCCSLITEAPYCSLETVPSWYCSPPRPLPPKHRHCSSCRSCSSCRVVYGGIQILRPRVPIACCRGATSSPEAVHRTRAPEILREAVRPGNGWECRRGRCPQRRRYQLIRPRRSAPPFFSGTGRTKTRCGSPGPPPTPR